MGGFALLTLKGLWLSVGPLLLTVVRVALVSGERSQASFIFGDSLVDGGNNNYLRSLSKANAPYFGIDFKASGGKPTGRFTNGKTIPDILGEELGVSGFAPPFLAPTTKGSALLQGVNYGSGGGGILNETGRFFINRLSMDQQLAYFRQTKKDLFDVLGSQEAVEKFVGNSIFSITMGANDYLNNYVLPVPNTRDFFVTPESFQKLLISRFRQQLITLYELGARKIIIVSVPPVGCTPYQRSLRYKSDGECAEEPNKFVSAYNNQLKDLVLGLNSQFPGAVLVYANSYDIALEIIENYQQYGFDESRMACCGTGGLYKGLIPCSKRAKLCPDRSKSFFWDPYHPSEAANILISKRLLDGDLNDIFPMNVRKLASL